MCFALIIDFFTTINPVSNFLVALGTIFLAGATLRYVFLTKQLVNISKKQVNLTEPILMFKFEFLQSILNYNTHIPINLENHGKSMAFNVDIFNIEFINFIDEKIIAKRKLILENNFISYFPEKSVKYNIPTDINFTIEDSQFLKDKFNEMKNINNPNNFIILNLEFKYNDSTSEIEYNIRQCVKLIITHNEISNEFTFKADNKSNKYIVKKIYNKKS